MSLFDQYQRDMRQHERSVHRMVDAFYIASRNTSVQKMVTSMQGGYLNQPVLTVLPDSAFETHRSLLRLLQNRLRQDFVDVRVPRNVFGLGLVSIGPYIVLAAVT